MNDGLTLPLAAGELLIASNKMAQEEKPLMKTRKIETVAHAVQGLNSAAQARVAGRVRWIELLAARLCQPRPSNPLATEKN